LFSRKKTLTAAALAKFLTEIWDTSRDQGILKKLEDATLAAGGPATNGALELDIVDLFCMNLALKKRPYGNEAVRSLVDLFYDSVAMPAQVRAATDELIENRWSEYHRLFQTSDDALAKTIASRIALTTTFDVLWGVKKHVYATLFSTDETLKDVDKKFNIVV
jgi:hypothetical protein